MVAIVFLVFCRMDHFKNPLVNVRMDHFLNPLVEPPAISGLGVPQIWRFLAIPGLDNLWDRSGSVLGVLWKRCGSAVGALWERCGSTVGALGDGQNITQNVKKCVFPIHSQ